jgi:hypothetical protein
MTTQACNLEYRTVIQGEDRVLPLRMTNVDGTPYPLTGVTEISVRFRKSDNTILELTLTGHAVTILDATLGRISVAIAADDTQSLMVGERQDFSVVIEKSTGIRKVNFKDAITIEKQSV